MILRLYVCPSCGEARLINPPLFGFHAQQLAAGNVYCPQCRTPMSYVHDTELAPLGDLGLCSECGGQFSDLPGHRAHAHGPIDSAPVGAAPSKEGDGEYLSSTNGGRGGA